MKQAALVSLALVAAALATTSSAPAAIYPSTPVTDSVITITTDSQTFTVPVFDVSTALTFGSESPVPTTESQPQSEPSKSGSSPSNSPNGSPSQTPPTSTSSSPAEQTSNFASPSRPEIVAALAGGLFAAVALV